MNPQAARARLQTLIDQHCLRVQDQPIRLSTGALSHFYFDCKGVTLDGEALGLIADLFLEEIRQFPLAPSAVGGLTMGADFLTAAIALRGFERGLPLVRGCIVRKEPKKHGTMNRIENEQPSGTPILVVDDVVTTGNATRQACEEFLRSGYRLSGIVALVDRQQGGCEALQQQFACPVRAIFRKTDFPRIAEFERRDALTASRA